MKFISSQLQKLKRQRIRKRRALAILVLLSVMVTLGVGWQLRLPGITLSDEPLCGLEAHEHTSACYENVGEQLCCGLEGQTLIHSHDALCLDAQGLLRCSLAVLPAHQHGETCYEPAVPAQLTCTLEEAAPHTHDEGCYGAEEETGEAILTCTLPEQTGHAHDENCFSPEVPPQLVCTMAELLPHTHNEGCYETSAETGEAALTCTLPEIQSHQHTEACLQTAEPRFFCQLPEHAHEDACYQPAPTEEAPPADETEPAISGVTYEAQFGDGAVTALALTEGDLPEGAAFVVSPVYGATTMALDSGDSGSNAFAEAHTAVTDYLTRYDGTLEDMVPLDMHFVDSLGNEIAPQGRTEVTLRFAQPILEGEGSIYALHITPEGAEDVTKEVVRDENGVSAVTFVTDSFSTVAMTRAITTTATVTVHQVNQSNQNTAKGLTLLVSSTTNTTVRAVVGGSMSFTYWDYYRVVPSGSRFVVQEIRTDDVSKLDMAVPANGFAVLKHGGAINTTVGDEVIPSSTFWRTAGYNANGLGTLRFGVPAKADKDNSSKLTEVTDYADTYDFITLNLYNYNSKINDTYNGNHNFPGFQQDGGTLSVGTTLGRFGLNFGNNITADIGSVISNVTTNSPGPINKTVNGANSSLVGTMYPTLKDGYPALADGTSLKGLFVDGGLNGAVTKVNTDNIDHLFRKIAGENGQYSYNSRVNHAQFDPSTNKFVVYHQMITSNYMMYPFGNFLPFNDIVHLAQQASLMDADYISSLADSAAAKAAAGMGDQYSTLSTVLDTFVTRMNSEFGTGWKPVKAVDKYFALNNLKDPQGNAITFSEDHLKNYYNIDYDEPTDFFFGMEMEMELMQPKNGLTGDDGQETMHFYFTGDDDVWVYLDGHLFLDLSGIHRHVGGAIDFQNGVIMKFDLNPATGDVGSTLAETTEANITNFEEILGTDSPLLQKIDGATRKHDGSTVYRFKDYSNHNFKFYYMERGAGSSVCRMNFNFPLLRKNSIRVTKEVSEINGRLPEILGDPDYKFQVLKAGTNELFIHANREYNVLDSALNVIETRKTDANGVFTLKAGQTAEFPDIEESSGKYFVRELMEPEVYQQYGYTIQVDGSSVTQDHVTDTLIDSATFKGVDSPEKDISQGSTTFDYDNSIIFNQLGSLQIRKVLNSLTDPDPNLMFRFRVTLDGKALPVGTAYTVGSEKRTTTEAGIISLAPGETAEIPSILAGTAFTVQETSDSALGYAVSYGDAAVDTSGEPYAYGTIQRDAAVAITVTNSEKGAALEIPLHKHLPNPDGAERTFQFTLQQVTDALGATAVENGTRMTTSLTLSGSQQEAEARFRLIYLEKDIGPGTYYYRITEDAGTDPLVRYDPAVHTVEVTLTDAYTAQITGWYRDGAKLDAVPPQAEFTNTLLTDLTIGKLVSGPIGTEAQFQFSLTLTQGGSPVTGQFPTLLGETPGTLTLDASGQGQITLTAGQTLTVRDLPSGVSWTVEELTTNGYAVSYTIGDAAPANGFQASGTATGSGAQVIFTNSASYQLPSTGGSGTLPYLMGGLLLMAAPLRNQISRRKRGRRGGRYERNP